MSFPILSEVIDWKPLKICWMVGVNSYYILCMPLEINVNSITQVGSFSKSNHVYLRIALNLKYNLLGNFDGILILKQNSS
jgi:hypothetical protein